MKLLYWRCCAVTVLSLKHNATPMPVYAKRVRVALAGLAIILLTSCASSPPKKLDNICHIFDEKDGWYKDAKKASERWDSPIPIMMAILHQESRFVAKAKPPRTKVLWIFPGPRKSDAYGYAQVKDATWDWYKKDSGHRGADRDDFDDAIDFVGWYNQKSFEISKIVSTDAYSLYLAYHEGHGGFNRKTYANKRWLTDVASKVRTRAAKYTQQLQACEKRLNSGWWFF